MPQPEAGHPRDALPVDFASTDKQGQKTIEHVFRHPVTHNLAWLDVIALFGKLGHVDEKSNGEVVFHAGAEQHLMRRPYGKELTTPEVIKLRQFLTQAGWSPDGGVPVSAQFSGRTFVSDCVVAIDHHEARIYSIEIGAEDTAPVVIRPDDPLHILHHLSHKDHDAEQGQRAPEDPAFYGHIATALAGAARIVIVGHGKGHSDAAQHLIAYLDKHNHEDWKRVGAEIAADLSAITPAQLVALGRSTLAARGEG
jgi:hypothetical protein